MPLVRGEDPSRLRELFTKSCEKNAEKFTSLFFSRDDSFEVLQKKTVDDFSFFNSHQQLRHALDRGDEQRLKRV